MTDTTRVDALSTALCLLDTFAGEGLGHTFGNGQTLDADTVVTNLCGAFAIAADAGWYRDLAAALVDDSTPPTFVAWLKRYCGQQDPARMRFSLGELAIAFKAGRETPPDAIADAGKPIAPAYVDLPPHWQRAFENTLAVTSGFSVHPRVRPAICETVWNVAREWIAEQDKPAPMSHRCETCGTKDGHAEGCAENVPPEPTPLEALKRLVFDLDALAASSEGVTGLHQNGEVATWSDIGEEGAFSAWLGEAMADARAVIDSADGEATGEDVPATNQAEEVVLREACERLLLAMTTRALRGRDHVPSMRDEQTAASALRAALATQPATSQEGEWVTVPREPTAAMVGAAIKIIGNETYVENTWSAMLAATPPSPTYTESQRERAKWALVGAYPEDGLGDAVDMVAEALGMRKAGA